jgi:hypothetical protein
MVTYSYFNEEEDATSSSGAPSVPAIYVYPVPEESVPYESSIVDVEEASFRLMLK